MSRLAVAQPSLSPLTLARLGSQHLPQLDHFRAYYPEELYPSEKVWLPSVFEPVKAAYLTFPQPLQIFLPEEPLPEDAQVGGLHQSQSTTDQS